jgi:PAS domain S-box-containing protein
MAEPASAGGEAAARLAELLELSFDAIFVWRPDLGIEFWNRGATELFGFSREEALGKPALELLQTRLPTAWSGIEAVLHAEGSWTGNVRHRARDGRQVFVSARMQRIVGADGVVRVLETNRDLSEWMQAEASIRRLKAARLEGLSSRIREVEFLLQPDGSFVEVNDHAVAQYGYSRGELLGMNVRQLRAAGEEGGLAEQLNQATHHESLRWETVHRRKDGATFPVEVSARSFTVGGQSYLHVLVRDLAERRRAEQTQRLLNSLIDQLPDAVILLDPDLRVREWSPSAERIFGWGASEARGRNLYSLLRPELGPAELEEIQTRFSSAEVVQSTANRRRKDGREIVTSSTVKAIRSPRGGSIEGFLAIARDVTEQQELRVAVEEIERLRAELRALRQAQVDSPAPRG